MRTLHYKGLSRLARAAKEGQASAALQPEKENTPSGEYAMGLECLHLHDSAHSPVPKLSAGWPVQPTRGRPVLRYSLRRENAPSSEQALHCRFLNCSHTTQGEVGASMSIITAYKGGRKL